MGLRIKTLIFCAFCAFGGGEDSRKTDIEGGIAWKGGAWTVCKFEGGLGKKEGGGVFEGGGGGVDIPMHAMFCVLGRQLGTYHQFQAFQVPKTASLKSFGNSWGYPYSDFLSDNNLIPFHLWQREIVLKREKSTKSTF